MFSLARPVVKFRPASKRSLSSPAITNVLIPRRSGLNVGPPIVPRSTTFSSDSPPLVVGVWARGEASAKTPARTIRDESRMLPPNDPAARRRTRATPSLHFRAGSWPDRRRQLDRERRGFSIGLTPNCRQHIEADLAKVVVGRDHGRHPQLTHDRKAGAVRERQVLITILEEEVPRSFETIVIDTLPSQPGAAIDLLPPCARGGRPETEPKQGQGLVDDEVGRDQDATRLERCVTGSRAGQMRGIAPVRACHPTARIDEHGVHREYKIAS